MLRRIVERTGARGFGVDASSFAIEEARARVARSSVADRIELRLADAGTIERQPAHDLVLCIGPGWDTGGWTALTGWAAAFVTPGGHLALADGAWRRRPTAGELRTLGMEIGAYPPSGRVEGLVGEAGVKVLWSHRASGDDWQAYGDRYRDAMLSFARAAPEDPLARRASERAGPGWGMYDLLHSLLDFVLVIGRP